MTVFGYIMLAVGVIVGAVMCIFLAIFIADKIHWYKNRKPCMHCSDWTLDVSDGHFPDCRDKGRPCCAACNHQHEMDNEDKFYCPADKVVMTKKSIDGKLIKDVCPVCGGTWTSDEELETIKKMSYDKGYSDGESAGIVQGTAMAYVTRPPNT